MFTQVVFTVYRYICTIILCVIFQFGFLRKEKRLSLTHLLSVYVFLFYLMNVYMKTGVGEPRGLSGIIFRVNLIPFFLPSDEFGLNISDILNILMLMPLGFLLPTIWSPFRSIKKVALTGFFFSLAIELSQLFNGRLADINDLIMNTLGAILGYLIHKALFKLMNKGKTDNKVSSLIIEYEPIIYLICSFIGMSVNSILYSFIFR